MTVITPPSMATRRRYSLRCLSGFNSGRVGPCSNAIQYARNDPINSIDPSGHEATPSTNPFWYDLPIDKMNAFIHDSERFDQSGGPAVPGPRNIFSSTNLDPFDEILQRPRNVPPTPANYGKMGFDARTALRNARGVPLQENLRLERDPQGLAAARWKWIHTFYEKSDKRLADISALSDKLRAGPLSAADGQILSRLVYEEMAFRDELARIQEKIKTQGSNGTIPSAFYLEWHEEIEWSVAKEHATVQTATGPLSPVANAIYQGYLEGVHNPDSMSADEKARLADYIKHRYGTELEKAQTPLPKIEAKAIAQMGADDRIREAMSRVVGSGRYRAMIGPVMLDKLNDLLSPESVNFFVGITAITIISHSGGWGEIADLIAFFLVGQQALSITGSLASGVEEALYAKTDADFDRSASDLAEGFAQLAIAAGLMVAGKATGEIIVKVMPLQRFGVAGDTIHRQTNIVFHGDTAVELPVKDIQPLHDVPREVKEPGYLKKLADVVRDKGFDRERGTTDVFRMPDGKYRMANGNHRLEVMKMLGEETIPARILDWTSVPKEAQQWFRNRFPDLNWF